MNADECFVFGIQNQAIIKYKGIIGSYKHHCKARGSMVFIDGAYNLLYYTATTTAVVNEITGGDNRMYLSTNCRPSH